VRLEQTSIDSQRLGERIPKHYKNRRPFHGNELLESTATEERDNITCWERCDIRGRLKGYVRRPGETRVEAGSNTSTVALRVVGGDENGSLESEAVPRDSDTRMTED
jgi:hypothetical protein